MFKYNSKTCSARLKKRNKTLKHWNIETLKHWNKKRFIIYLKLYSLTRFGSETSMIFINLGNTGCRLTEKEILEIFIFLCLLAAFLRMYIVPSILIESLLISFICPSYLLFSSLASFYFFPFFRFFFPSYLLSWKASKIDLKPTPHPGGGRKTLYKPAFYISLSYMAWSETCRKSDERCKKGHKL